MEGMPADAGVAEAGPEPSGEAGSEAIEQPEGGEEEPAPSRQYVEIDDPDNRYERVKVAGEELEVPYSELVKGYSREADYTRKAQALAQQRQEAEYAINLQRALQANPDMTLRILAEQYGLSGQQGQQAPVQEEDEYVDPLERAIADERRARLELEERITQREVDEQLNRAIGGLRQQFNLNDEDVRAVVNTAYEGGFGIEALPMIYKTMAFDRINARVQAQRAQQAAQQAETQRRTAAKSQAGQVVSSGGVGANGLTSQMDAGGNMTLREAIEAAWNQAEGG